MPGPSSEPWYKTYRSYLVVFGSLVAFVAGYYLWSSYGPSYDTYSLPNKNGEVIRTFQPKESLKVRQNAAKVQLLAVKTQEMDAKKVWGSESAKITEQWKELVTNAKAEHDAKWFSSWGLRGTVVTPAKLGGMPSTLKDEEIMADNFRVTPTMVKTNFQSKFKLSNAEKATVKETFDAEKKAHDDFYDENSETWINSKNVDRAAGAGVGLLAGAGVAGVGLLGAGEEKKKPSSSNTKRPSRRNPPRTDNTKKGKTSGQKTEPKANGKGNESGGKGLIIFLIILACLAAVAAGIYIFCFMGKDEDFDDEELVAEDV